MKKIKNILYSSIVICVLLLGSFAFALGKNCKIITIPASKSGWNYSYDSTRTGNYSYVETKCVAIDSNKSTIATAIYNTNMSKISDEYILVAKTNSSNFTKVKIREGYLSTKKLYVGFRGTSNSTSSYDAWVVYDTK